METNVDKFMATEEARILRAQAINDVLKYGEIREETTLLMKSAINDYLLASIMKMLPTKH